MAIAKLQEKKKAISLRKQGFSYREILQQVPVAKSSLSLWLYSVGLSKKQKQRLTQKKLDAARRGWEKIHQLRMERWQKIKENASKEIKLLSKKEKWLLGIALYWAEGAKEKEYRGSTDIKFSNSDVLMVLIFKNWLTEFYKIPEERLRYGLYIHEKADWIKARKFWATKLGIPANDIGITFKKHNPSPKRKNIGKEYNGLVRIEANGTINLVRKIDGWVQGICRHWGVV